jgi:hypothetical protein
MEMLSIEGPFDFAGCHFADIVEFHFADILFLLMAPMVKNTPIRDKLSNFTET